MSLPISTQGYSRRGLACFFLKKYDEALHAYEKGLELDPDNDVMKSGVEQVKVKVQAQDANEKGEEFVAKGKFFDGISRFDEAIRLDPTEASFLTNRSDAQLSAGRPSLALDDANLAVALRPNWAKGYQRRAEALCRLDRWDEAAAAYGNALRCDPNNSKFQSELNRAAQEGFRFRARQEMEEATRKDSESQKE